MEKQRAEPSQKRTEGPEIEYRYIVHVRALEALANTLSAQQVFVPVGVAHLSFSSSKRLNMRAFKENGLIWSYSIIRVRTSEDVIEEG